MSVQTFRGEKAPTSRAGVRAPVVFLFLVALAVIAPSAVFFWPDGDRSIASVADPEFGTALEEIRAGQQVTTNAIKVVNDNLAAGRANMKTLADQLSVLAARVDALQNAEMQALRDNAELSGRITAIQAEKARDDASTKQARDQDQIDIAGAKTSDTAQSKTPLPPARPTAARKRKPTPQQAKQPEQPPQPSTQARFLSFFSRP